MRVQTMSKNYHFLHTGQKWIFFSAQGRANGFFSSKMTKNIASIFVPDHIPKPVGGLRPGFTFRDRSARQNNSTSTEKKRKNKIFVARDADLESSLVFFSGKWERIRQKSVKVTKYTNMVAWNQGKLHQI